MWGYLGNEERRARMGFASGTSLGTWLETTFFPPFDAYNHAWEAWKNPATRTTVITTVFVDAEKVFIPVFRELYTGLLRGNPLVTDDDLNAMGLPERSSGGRQPSPDPTTTVEAEVATPSPGVVEIHFRNAESEHRAKPEGVHGAEIKWLISDTPPAGWDALTNSVFDTRTPYVFSFAYEDRGKRLYYALRWENTRGVKGPWNEIQSVIIP
jgi:hypothetical protein